MSTMYDADGLSTMSTCGHVSGYAERGESSYSKTVDEQADQIEDQAHRSGDILGYETGS